MSMGLRFGVLLVLVAASSCLLADGPHNLMPSSMEVRALINERCAYLDSALTEKGASDRCERQMLNALVDLGSLSRDQFIPAMVWMACRESSGSMHSANFDLWAKCVRVAKAGCNLRSEHVGLGITISPKNGGISVVSVAEGSPA